MLKSLKTRNKKVAPVELLINPQGVLPLPFFQDFLSPGKVTLKAMVKALRFMLLNAIQNLYTI
jgi:hypothetical protein